MLQYFTRMKDKYYLPIITVAEHVCQTFNDFSDITIQYTSNRENLS